MGIFTAKWAFSRPNGHFHGHTAWCHYSVRIVWLAMASTDRAFGTTSRPDHKEHSSVMHKPSSPQIGHRAHRVVEVILDHGPQHGEATVRCQQRSQVHVGAVVKEKIAKEFEQGEDLRRSHHGSSRLRVRPFVTIFFGPLVLNQASRKKQAKQVPLSSTHVWNLSRDTNAFA